MSALPELPRGWVWKTVAELAAEEPNAITDGPFGSNLKTAHYTESGPRVIRLQNIGDAEFNDAKAHISTEHYERLAKHSVKAGDIVIAALGEALPRACLIPGSVGPAIVKADCVRFRPDPAQNAKYLNYALNSEATRRLVRPIVHGVGRPRLNLREIKAIPLPVAPREQQDLIVQEIEELLTRLQAGVAALKRVQANLKRYRAAVLKAACEGRLVPTEAALAHREGRPHEPAVRLLVALQEQRRTLLATRYEGRSQLPPVEGEPRSHGLSGLPQGWVWARLGQLVWSVKDGPHYSPPYVPEGVPFITGGNVRPEGVDFAAAKQITQELHLELCKRCRPEKGDILYTKGGTTGIARLNTYDREFSVWVHVAVLKLVPGFDGRYLQHALNSPFCHSQARALTHGVGNQDLGLTRMVRIVVPLPPVAEQRRIVAEIERRLSYADDFHRTLTAALDRAEPLRRSILVAAFQGRYADRGQSAATDMLPMKGEDHNSPAGVLSNG